LKAHPKVCTDFEMYLLHLGKAVQVSSFIVISRIGPRVLAQLLVSTEGICRCTGIVSELDKTVYIFRRYGK
jgi:hypothetical protein